MGCEAVDSWTFAELVGAFLDLAIAYFLLCGSTSAHITSKFLRLFGLSLPCPCNGLFGKPSNSKPKKCPQGILVECPFEKISDVHLLVNSKFPFNSILASESNSPLSLELLRKKNAKTEHVAFKGKASCGLSKENSGRESSFREKGFNVKAKVVTNQRLRHGIRCRRKFDVNNDKSASVSSLNPLLSDVHSVSESPASISKMGIEIMESSGDNGHMGGEDFNCGSPTLKKDIYILSESDEVVDEKKGARRDVSIYEEFKSDLQGELSFDGNDKDTIRFLEQALKKEHVARSALYLELEKERNAAATAADEAMAMMFRLQEEKAAIEMEARQYKRMVEEKSAYDAEEMNILKDILLRREREKHFLEKEVEALRQIPFGIEQLDVDMDNKAPPQAQRLSSSFYLTEDPVLVQPQVNGSIDKKEEVKDASNTPAYKVTSIGLHDCTVALGKELPVPKGDEVVHEKTVTSIGEKQEVIDKAGIYNGLNSKARETGDETKIVISYNEGNTAKDEKDSCASMLERNLFIQDVHVVSNESNTRNEMSGQGEDLFNNCTLDIPKHCDRPTINRLETQVHVTRSTSDMFDELQHFGFSKGKASLSNLRRNSMSVFDYERLKIDDEVGRLRERLRIVQEGREKLNFSVGHFESNKVQVQMLEDIAAQLRDIRQSTELGIAVRQVSLPVVSTKALRKRRPWRSVSLVPQRSS